MDTWIGAMLELWSLKSSLHLCRWWWLVVAEEKLMHKHFAI